MESLCCFALLQVVDNSFREFSSRGIAAKILCANLKEARMSKGKSKKNFTASYLASLQHMINGIIDLQTVVHQINMAQHF